MSSVDDRIVNMQFNNKQFTQGVTESQKSLEGLEKTLAGTATGKGLTNMAAGVQSISDRFGALKLAGATAIATIAQKATTAGLSLLKSLTIDPIMDGFREYTTNLNSIQVIMANTGKKVDVVNKYLNDLNKYSDQTIYNFSQMAGAIGKFTAAGVDLPAATSAIKGMANAAALSGADANQLNTAMYQMSQALASGTIKLMDWNSLVNANMAGENIQKALMSTARSTEDQGKAMQFAIDNAGNFRESLSKGWLTSEIFTKTMKVMAGTTDEATQKTVAFSVAQLQQMGYTKENAKELHKLSGASIDAATKIKTIPQMIDVIKESVGSGFGKLFQDLFGNFDQSVSMWTKVGTAVTGAVSKIFTYVDTILVGWRDLGGYRALWASFGNIFQALGNILRPFMIAFKSLLPETGKAGQGLANFTKGFRDVTKWIEVATRGFESFAPAISGVFGAFKEGISIVGSLIKAIGSLVSGGGISGFMNSLGDAGGHASGFFGLILSGLSAITAPFGRLSDIFDNLKDKIEGLKDSFGGFSNSIDPNIGAADALSGAAKRSATIWSTVGTVLAGVGRTIKTVFSTLGDAIGWVMDKLGGLFSGMGVGDWAKVFNSILTGVVLLSIKKFIDNLSDFSLKISGFGESFIGVFDQLTGTLKTMQQSIKAKMLKDIAISVGILAASIVVLSFIKPARIASSLGAIASLLGMLVVTLTSLTKIQKGGVNMTLLAASMMLISAAMINLSIAVAILGHMDLATLAKGLGAMAAALGLMIGTLVGLSKIGGGLVKGAASLFIVSLAMNMLATAVLAFGHMDMDVLAKGFGAVAAGLILMIGALGIMGLMQGSVMGSAAAMLIMAGAMTVLASAVAIFGNMSIETLAKGMGAMAVGLLLMVGALMLMSGNTAGVLAGAAAMAVMAGAMSMIATVVLALGAAPWENVARGLGFVAAALAIFLLAAAGAMFVGPGLLILGASVALLGIAMALAGVGMLAFATGMALMAASGMAAIKVMEAAIKAFVGLLPTIASAMAEAIVSFLEVLAKNAPRVRESFGTILKSILGSVRDAIPELRKLFQTLINNGIKVIEDNVPKFIELGFTIIDEFLKSANRHIPSIAASGIQLVTKFITAIGNEAPKLADAAAKAIVKFINGLTEAINNNADDLRQAGLDLAVAIVDGITGGLLSKGITAVENAVNTLMDHIPGWAKKAMGINSPAKVMIPVGKSVAEGVAVGIMQSATQAVNATMTMANAIIAEGNKAIMRAQKEATKAQSKAYEEQTKADMANEKAKKAEAFARHHEKNKEAQKRAEKLRRQADTAQKHADKKQTRADKVAEHAAGVVTFQTADNEGKGDFKNAEAAELADRANQKLAQANAEADHAREVMKTNKKRGQELLDQAKDHAKKAKELANAAQKAHEDAETFYAAAAEEERVAAEAERAAAEQRVRDRIKDLEDNVAADAQARADEKELEDASDASKVEILQRRQAADEARAAAEKARALQLIEQARAIAATDAEAAMALLDEAERAAQNAQEAADKAEQEKDAAAQLIQQISDAASQAQNQSQTPTEDTNLPGSGAGGILPSRSVLEDAASAVDRYTASLAQASSAAGATSGVIQFVQHNTSPAALTASEIYRQSKNLVSAAELKMGA